MPPPRAGTCHSGWSPAGRTEVPVIPFPASPQTLPSASTVFSGAGWLACSPPPQARPDRLTATGASQENPAHTRRQDTA